GSRTSTSSADGSAIERRDARQRRQRWRPGRSPPARKSAGQGRAGQRDPGQILQLAQRDDDGNPNGKALDRALRSQADEAIESARFNRQLMERKLLGLKISLLSFATLGGVGFCTAV